MGALGGDERTPLLDSYGKERAAPTLWVGDQGKWGGIGLILDARPGSAVGDAEHKLNVMNAATTAGKLLIKETYEGLVKDVKEQFLKLKKQMPERSIDAVLVEEAFVETAREEVKELGVSLVVIAPDNMVSDVATGEVLGQLRLPAYNSFSTGVARAVADIVTDIDGSNGRVCARTLPPDTKLWARALWQREKTTEDEAAK